MKIVDMSSLTESPLCMSEKDIYAERKVTSTLVHCYPQPHTLDILKIERKSGSSGNFIMGLQYNDNPIIYIEDKNLLVLETAICNALEYCHTEGWIDDQKVYDITWFEKEDERVFVMTVNNGHLDIFAFGKPGKKLLRAIRDAIRSLT